MVVPTCVGVNRCISHHKFFKKRGPHVCGGEPMREGWRKGLFPWSPRVWG